MEEEFWEIVSVSGSPCTLDPNDQCCKITEALTNFSQEKLISFANTHIRLLAKLDSWPLLKAAYVTLGYVSDDVFEDFRNWIILHGKDKYYKTLEDPECVADYAQVNDPVEEICGEALLYVCDNAWSGDIEELESGYEYPPVPRYEIDWPTREELAREFPKLAARFNFGKKKPEA